MTDFEDKRGPTLLLAALILCHIGQITWVSWWLSSLFFLFAVTHITTQRLIPQTNRFWDNAIAITVFLVIYASHRHFPDVDSGGALLSFLCLLKLRQIQAQRDFIVAALIICFQICLLFIRNQSIQMALYGLFLCIMVTAALMLPYARPQPRMWLHALKQAAVMAGKAAVFMVLLFIFFPRIPGPLWSFGKTPEASITGLSDSMELNSISNLLTSDEIAFRAVFPQVRPEIYQMYWRGPVLSYTNGRKWTARTGRPKAKPRIIGLSEAIPYSITLEPQSNGWLLALDAPTGATIDARLTPNMRLLTKPATNSRQRHELSFFPLYRLLPPEGLEPEEHNLQLPRYKHKKTRELARQWQQSGMTPDQIVKQALRFFNEENFIYTLSPAPLAGVDLIDEFLFDTREGYCEHYASSFVTLMRAAGIPARVVTGYQGGEKNPLGEYYVVRQRDAHAWAEVWLGNGWERVDPTSVIAPERLEQGLQSFLDQIENPITATNAANWRTFNRGLWRNGRDYLDFMENQWNQWVITYGSSQRSRIATSLGLKEYTWQFLLVVLCLIFGAYALWPLLRQKKQADPLVTAYKTFRSKLAEAGVATETWQGPLYVGATASRQLPTSAKEINEIIRLYVKARYDEGDPGPLSTLVQQFPDKNPGPGTKKSK